ncbi:MAG: tetratricopeptide repeat protein [Polyangiales bacterium]
MKRSRAKKGAVKLPAWALPVVVGVGLAGFTAWAWPPRDEVDPRVARGNAAYARRAFPEALQDYEAAPGDGARNVGVHRNRGIARFRIALPPGDGGVLPELERDAAVPEGWSRMQDELRNAARGGDGVAVEDIPAMVRARAQYDLGNTHFARHEWREAIDAYKEALRLRPGWVDAAWNMELARRRRDDDDHPDAGPDAGQDASTDGGQPDSGPPDAGNPDGGSPDGGSPDGGNGDGGAQGDGGDPNGDAGGPGDAGDNQGDGGNGEPPDAGQPEGGDGGAQPPPPQSLAPLDQLERNAQDLQQMLLRRRAMQTPRNPDDER